MSGILPSHVLPLDAFADTARGSATSGTKVFIHGPYGTGIARRLGFYPRVDIYAFAECVGGSGAEVLYFDALPKVSDPPKAGEEERWRKKLRFLEALNRRGVRTIATEEPSLVDFMVRNLEQFLADGQMRRLILVANQGRLAPTVTKCVSQGVRMELYHQAPPFDAPRSLTSVAEVVRQVRPGLLERCLLPERDAA